MPLPRAIQKQVDEANQFMEEQARAAVGEAEDDEQDEGQRAAGETDEQQDEEEGQQQAASAAAEAEGRDEDEDDEGAADDERAPNFEQKYRVLKGKYDAEVPRLSRELRETKDELREVRSNLQTLREHLANRQRAPAGQQQPPQGVQTEAERLISDEEIEEYGQDFVDLVGRRAQEVARTMMQPLQEQIASLKQQLGQVGTRVDTSDREKMFAQLDREVKNWRGITKQEGFVDWLDQKDPYSGVERGRLLKRAFETNDTDRVIAFYRGYLKENAVTSASDGDGGPSDDTDDTQQQAGMDGLVAPGKPRGTGRKPSGAQRQGRIWTEAEINQFYADRQHGKFRKDPKEADRIEREIFKAMAEGRVRAHARPPHANAAY